MPFYLQPTNSNVELLQRYAINLTCTKVKKTSQPCGDTANQKPFHETMQTPSARWGRDPDYTSRYAKAQDCSIFSTST